MLASLHSLSAFKDYTKCQFKKPLKRLLKNYVTAALLSMRTKTLHKQSVGATSVHQQNVDQVARKIFSKMK